MKKTFGAGATLAVLLACASPMALAASSSMADTGPAPVGTMIQSDQVRANKMIGASVYDRNNVKLGSVQDLVLDRDGRVAAVVIDVGSFLGMGGKDVAVRFSDIKTDHNRLTLDRTKAQLKQMAAYHLRDRNTGAGTTESPVNGGRLGSGTSAPNRH